jgi:hypothetical protein
MSASLFYRVRKPAFLLSLLTALTACDSGDPEFEYGAQRLLNELRPGMTVEEVVALANEIMPREPLCAEESSQTTADGTSKTICTSNQVVTDILISQVNISGLQATCSMPNTCFPADVLSIIPLDSDGRLLAKYQNLRGIAYGASLLTLSPHRLGGINAIYNVENELIGVVVLYLRPLVPPAFD